MSPSKVKKIYGPPGTGKTTFLLNIVEQELENNHFFRSSDLRPTMIINIRNIFARSDLTDQEVRTLHGIISALTGQKNVRRLRLT